MVWVRNLPRFFGERPSQSILQLQNLRPWCFPLIRLRLIGILASKSGWGVLVFVWGEGVSNGKMCVYKCIWPTKHVNKTCDNCIEYWYALYIISSRKTMSTSWVVKWTHLRTHLRCPENRDPPICPKKLRKNLLSKQYTLPKWHPQNHKKKTTWWNRKTMISQMISKWLDISFQNLIQQKLSSWLSSSYYQPKQCTMGISPQIYHTFCTAWSPQNFWVLHSTLMTPVFLGLGSCQKGGVLR